MIKTILRYELLNLHREKLITGLIVVSCLLTLMGLANSQRALNEQMSLQSSTVAEQQTAIEHAKAQFAQRQLSTQPVNWWEDSADVRGYAFYLMIDYAVKPPSPLASLAIGQSDIYPNFFRMQVDTKQTIFQAKDSLHPLLRYLGKLDLAFFLVFILPLLLIAINFTAVTQEREREQLKIMIIQGLSPAKLLALQLAVRSSLILIPIIFIASFWLAYVEFTIFNISSTTILLDISTFLLMLMAYSLFWIGLTSWSISQGKSSAYNATILISAWLVFVIAIPMTTNTLLKVMAPLPSRIAYIDTLRAATDDIGRKTEQTLAGFFQDHPELATPGQTSGQNSAVIKIAKIDAIEKAMIKTESDFSQKLSTQQSVSAKLQWLSPASLFYKGLVDLSGNGLTQHHAFLMQAEPHHKKLRQYFQARIIAADKSGAFNPCEGCQTPPTFTDFDQQPRFVFTENNQTQVTKPVVISLLCIFLALILLRKAAYRLNKV